jgi:hypothetical protein
MLRTLPRTCAPLALTTKACVPTAMRASSAEVTSARHSRRPWRIRRKSSVPAATTLPTVAVRAEITPSSGASTCVLRPRTCCAASTASAASTRALAVCSVVWYWLICCWLSAPVACSVRARAALPAASAAVALASASEARDCAMSACTVSGENTASTWPFLTTSPTFTRTSASLRPLDSEPTTASCQAATLPLAASVTVSSVASGLATVTVSEGLGAGAPSLASLAPLDLAAAACSAGVPEGLRTSHTAATTTMTSASSAMTRVERFIVFMVTSQP